MCCDSLQIGKAKMERYKNRCILINILKEMLEKDEDVLFAYLYGSHAYGFAYLEIDVDIALYLKPSGRKGFIEKEKKLTSIMVAELHNDKTDLKILNVSPILLRYEILKKSISVLIRDEAEKVDFDTRVMNGFFSAFFMEGKGK